MDFRGMLRAIRNSQVLDYDGKEYLLNYVNGIKNGTRENEFFDFDILNAFILKFANGNISCADETQTQASVIEDKLKKIINNIKIQLPLGVKTEDYESIKASIINTNGEFNKKLFLLLENKYDYTQILNLINEKYNSYEKEVISNYAVNVCPYCVNQKQLKAEIISFINGLDNLAGSVNEYSEKRLAEAKKRVGIYPLDEASIANISLTASRAQSLIKKLENMETRVNTFEERIKRETDTGIKTIDKHIKDSSSELQIIVNAERDRIVKVLDEYLKDLETALKKNSDIIFNQILENAQNELKTIKLYAESLSTTTTADLIKIKSSTEESINAMKEYIQDEPMIKNLVESYTSSNEFKTAMLQMSQNKPKVIAVDSVESPSKVILNPISNSSLEPLPAVVIPVDSIDRTILPSYDTKIPFKERYEKVLKRLEEREKNGEVFHKSIKEIITNIMVGDWVHLYGPSGTGKSTLIEQAIDLIGSEIVDNGKILDSYSILAYNDPHGRFRPTPTFDAVLKGKALLFEEMDSGDPDTEVVLGSIYSKMKKLYKNPDQILYTTFGERISTPIHPNFRMLATSNTNGGGANSVYSARSKMDEAILQRLIPTEVDYDKNIEKKIFNGYTAWNKVFEHFRDACNRYAKTELHLESTPGVITTRDASDIVDYINQKCKGVDQIIREKFIQTKNRNYLESIYSYLENIYHLESELSNPLEAQMDPSTVDEKQLAKCLMYRCKNPKF